MRVFCVFAFELCLFCLLSFSIFVVVKSYFLLWFVYFCALKFKIRWYSLNHTSKR